MAKRHVSPYALLPVIVLQAQEGRCRPLQWVIFMGGFRSVVAHFLVNTQGHHA